MYLYNKLKWCPAYTALSCFYSTLQTEAAFLDEIQTKVLRVFLLAIHSHLYRYALRFLFLQTHATSYSFYSSVIVHCKVDRRKTWQKTIPSSLWFKKSIQKPQIWENSRLCPETSTKKLYVHELSFRTVRVCMNMCIHVHLDLENWHPAVHTILPMILTAYIHILC
jgi:hypothetical protein